ncbi:unnamed protein product [Trichobilharzia szidati]|nr:unnamed protein product [Trichobilharzia szidati]
MSSLLKTLIVSKLVKVTVNDFTFGRKPYLFAAYLVPLNRYCTSVETVKNTNQQTKENLQNKTNIRKNYKNKPYRQADLATSLEYLNSDVYRNTYRGKPVWFYYRRNYKGHFPPSSTRKNCVYLGKLISSNPCPICRDEYLVLHHQHTELLKQFLNPDTLQIFPTAKTGLCQHQHKILQMEVEKARDLGTIQMCTPFYLYDYNDYYDYLPTEQLNELLKINGRSMNISSADLITLPSDIQDILQTYQSIPHAVEFYTRLPKVDIIPPKIVNRYQMEEKYKELLQRRRRSHSLILN